MGAGKGNATKHRVQRTRGEEEFDILAASSGSGFVIEEWVELDADEDDDGFADVISPLA
ncbi:hypothetical protein SNOG_06312 [Parastagonospora nodorum SN15]|uniref:Uncharacterized protein n=1 Tax=Phaeosphaeria nodorum (strain SN15 / ATCC MYA-4574 / FGSC 10173) TaxID=321614 RepID=Q0UPK2_PHANO|nr:hypothetical protein SNOG_06312 [Parastagonospora nodorum SN15]EAT86143.1 hypothetical protein SNOG_06312 [Parastagonospora nodorum SN15]